MSTRGQKKCVIHGGRLPLPTGSGAPGALSAAIAAAHAWLGAAMRAIPAILRFAAT